MKIKPEVSKFFKEIGKKGAKIRKEKDPDVYKKIGAKGGKTRWAKARKTTKKPVKTTKKRVA